MRVLKLGMKGSDVMEVQALLRKIGCNPGTIDGIFGRQTDRAVMQFQKSYGLAPDGIIGADTNRVLERFLLGYDNYTIKTGDTIYNIAKRYYTTINRILTANPGIAVNNLSVGRRIIVPYGGDVVDTNINYTYEIMEKDIQGLKVRYPFITTGIAGKSVLGKDLYYIKLGNGPNKVFYNGAHHSLEWITSVLLIKFIENFSKAYADGNSLSGYNVRDIWNKSTIYILPMVNPDGVNLVLDGMQQDNPFCSDLVKWNNGSTDFSRHWQANIRGVDLNHNYDASWNMSKQAEVDYGVTGPGPTRFSGQYPESEPESKAVANFTRDHNFRLVIAYHTQGEVIYWTYLNIIPTVAQRIARIFSKVSGYTLSQTSGIVSYSGYKDWFIETYGKPGFTIEIGSGRNPLPISQFNKIYNDNIEILLLAAIV